MTIPQSAGGKRTLPVFGSIVQAYRNVLSRPKRLIVLAAVPVAANLVIAGLTYAGLRGMPFFDGPSVACLLLVLLPLSYLGMAWAQQSSTDAPPKLLGVPFWCRACGWSLCCHLLWIPLIVVALLGTQLIASLIVLSVLSPDGGSTSLSWGQTSTPMSLLAVASLSVLIPAVFARLFLVVPLAAARRAVSFRAAWKAGRGFALRLGTAVLCMTLSHLLLAVTLLSVAIVCVENVVFRDAFGIVLIDSLSFHFRVAMLLTCAIMLPLGTVLAEALFAELTVIAFRQITGLDGVQTEIVERFA